MSSENKWFIFGLTYVLLIIFAIFFVGPARGHDVDHPELDAWYSKVYQPTNPSLSCCGKADAYWCDVLETFLDKEGITHNYCRITDLRDDEPLQRKHIPVGTRIEIPRDRIKWTKEDPQSSNPNIERNPTGHSIVFLSRGMYVYCFIMGILT